MKRERSLLKAVVASFVAVVLLVSVSIIKAQTNSDISTYFATAPVISDIKPDSMTVEWGSYPNLNKTTHYQVQINNMLYGTSTRFNRYELTKMTPGRTAKVAITTYHEGKIAGVSSATTVLMPPDPPKGITGYNVGSASVGLIWRKTISATEYRVYEYPNVLLASVDGASNSVYLTGLNPGASMTFIVTAVNSGGESYMSSKISVQLLPPPPVMSVKSDEIGASWFILHWTPVEKAISYTVLVNDEEKATVDANTLEYRVDSLATGTSVSVKMKAVNETGGSEFSEPIIIELLPDTPILSLVTVSSFSCTLRWSAANGAQYYKLYQSSKWAIGNYQSTVFSVTLTDGITPGTVASYTIKAVNGAGESDFSNSVVATFTSVSSEATLLALKPDYMANGIPELRRIAEQYRGSPLVVVQFPKALKNPELALEAGYLNELASDPTMKDVRFLVIFSSEVPSVSSFKSKNIRWMKTKKRKALNISQKIPVVCFYNSDGWLQKVTRVSMIILTESDIYKWLPEVFESGKRLENLYREEIEKFNELHDLK